MTTATARFRESVVEALAVALRIYTRRAPFKRGRGIFIRLIERLKRMGWPAPLLRLDHELIMEFEPSLLGWTLFERGTWEPAQTSVVQSLLAAGQVVVNVGANTGYYTLLAARRVGEGGRVYAFEIQPAILDILQRNIQRNDVQDIVTVVPMGCFSSSGEAVIEQHGDAGSARIAFRPDGLRVPLVTLDDYAEMAVLDRLDLILIDAEGADFEILKGAASILAKFRPVVLAEVHHLAAFAGSEEELRRFMARFGYAATELQSEFSRDLLFISRS